MTDRPARITIGHVGSVPPLPVVEFE